MANSYKAFLPLVIFGISTMAYSSTSRADANKNGFQYGSYAVVLKSYVDDTGMVNYRELKANMQRLETFVASLATLDANSYNSMSNNEQIAFWLNAYNSLTLKVIIDNFPIKPSFFRSRVYPKNSIRQIPGVWDKIAFNIVGQDLTLGHIEHEILRKKFDEPRIHMAMVCAAMGCPPLRNEPYVPGKLDKHLDDQTRKFLANTGKFRIDRQKSVVYLSPILKWFANDFVKKHAPKNNIAKHKRKTSAVLNFVAEYLAEPDTDYILKGDFKVKYLKYDWSLNEQQPTKNKSKRKQK